MDPAQIVRVSNVGETDFRDGFDGVQYRIPANQNQYVPLGAAVTWLGDPTTIGAERGRELERLGIRYGSDPRATEQPGTNLPELEVFDQATGEQIVFPLNDPTNFQGVPTLAGSEGVVDLAAQVRYLQDQINEMNASKSGKPAAKRPAKGQDGLDQIPTDDPGKTSVKA